MAPKLLIDLEKLRFNAATLGGWCRQRGLSVAAVTKVFCGQPEMTGALVAAGVDYLADSRLENIARYKDAPGYAESGLKTILLRAPTPEGATETVAGCDISLGSELSTMRALADAAKAAGRQHGVLLMIDMGDLREGLYHGDAAQIEKTAAFVAGAPWLKLYGVGVNLTCYGSVIPGADCMERFVEIAERLQQRLGQRFEIVSGGNSSSIRLMLDGGMPGGVNNLRLGESIVRAEEAAYQTHIEGLHADVVTLEAELIEVQEKPSMPEGPRGFNAFREKAEYRDRGRRLRGILALGRQDVEYQGLRCFDEGVEVLGASSDHLIVDLAEARQRCAVGDALRFSLSYPAILRAFTSEYVEKTFI